MKDNGIRDMVSFDIFSCFYNFSLKLLIYAKPRRSRHSSSIAARLPSITLFPNFH